MCTLPLAILGLLAGGTTLSAVGAIQSGQATAASHKYNAQIAEMNAELADRQAKDAIERGASAEQRKRQEVASIMGAQQAAMAANGLDLTFGSPLDIMVDTAVMGELDALTIRSNAYREAYDYRVGAVTQRGNAAMGRMAASSALTSGYLNAGGTILGGAGQAIGAYQSALTSKARAQTYGM